MALAAGTRLGAYEIQSSLGAGGMGEVYRALDTELQRVVALKVLPDHFASDADRVARFEREATTLALINHQHVAQIYGTTRCDDERRVLVMEYVEGEDLAARIRRGPLPVDEALAIGRQIASALEAAHDIGVIHRDLKPANIKVRSDGVVKVLDFGLARALDVPLSMDDRSPTISPAMTDPGIVLGTAAYMSPEQAKGLNVDRRSDMWSWGNVLFEMLSGQRVFGRTTVVETMAAVLSSGPDWDLLPADTPEPIRRLLRQCLTRERSHRLDSAAVARIQIDEVLSGATPEMARQTEARRLSMWWLAGGAAAAAAVATAVFLWLPRSPAPLAELRLDIATPPAADAYSFALSPDGQRIAYVAGRSDGPLQLWIRAFDSGTATAVPNTEGAVYPFWSPDSRSIGFFANGKLKRVDASGGAAVTLADAAAGRGGSWSVHGEILFTQSASGPISVVPAAGSAARAVTALAPGDGGHLSPAWHPDGQRFLFFVQSGDSNKRGVYLATIDRPDRTRLLTSDGGAEFRSPRQIMYVRDGTLHVQEFDEASNTVVGAAAQVANPIPTSATRSAFAASLHGPIAYRTGRTMGRQLRWYGRNGDGEEPFASPDTEGVSGPVLSPSGQRVAHFRRAGGNTDIWISDPGGGAASRLTTDPAQELFPLWMPDESAVVFRSSRSGKLDIYSTRVDAEGNDTLLLRAAAVGVDQISPTDISRDGRWLLFYSTSLSASRDLWAYALGPGGGRPRKILATSADESNPRFSPDGRWIAYQTNESGVFEIAVRGFPSVERMWQISSGGGTHARWSRDGKELFYVAPDGRLMAVPVDGSGAVFRTGPVVPLFVPRFAESPATNPFNTQYDVAADGRFLINIAVDDLASSPITLILNWRARN